VIETRKRLLAQIKARQRQGLDEPLKEMDAALRLLLDTQIGALETQIELLIRAEDALAQTAKILRSVSGIGPVASSMLIAEMP
jgi:transposase